MTKDNDDYLEPRQLALELLKSIREIDCRIDELKLIYGMVGDDKPDGFKREITRRIERLIDTRFKLIYSFNDLVPVLNSYKFNDGIRLNPFENLKLDYKDFKRKI